ncbi:hypothetical protein L6V77_12090 [Myxococcota bacterium]|nr:hypothetical protein [Myxococcota bacterium]
MWKTHAPARRLRGLSSLALVATLSSMPTACGGDDSGDPSAAAGGAGGAAVLPPGDATTTAPDQATPAPPDARPSAPGADAANVTPADAAADALAPDAAAPPSGPLPPPPRTRPVSTGTLSAPAGWRWARGLIHMHSIHSHDACDGRPKDENGVGNAPCLADLRAALCNARLDYTLLTDHPETFADVSFEEALLFDEAAGDELVRDPSGAAVGNFVACAGEDAVRTLLSPGSEGDLMPVMLPQPAGDRGWYRDRTAESVSHLHETGGLVFHAHTEERTYEELEPLGLDAIEIYNLHANVNPRWRQLGEVMPDILALINARESPPHPDLSMLAVLRENPESVGVWNQFVHHRRMLGTAGSDIHQNLPPLVRPIDGERLDSYRRLTTWFANYLLVHEVTLPQIREALTAGRLVVVFHLLGEPDGFDFAGTAPDGSRIELGDERPFEAGMTLRVTPPRSVPEAQQDVKLVRVTADGAEVIAQGPMALEVPVPGPGAYRVEILQVPEHMRAELGSLGDRFVRPTPWIYTNHIYLR